HVSLFYALFVYAASTASLFPLSLHDALPILSSLSVDPPSVIVSLNRNASSWPILQRERVFGANLLAADQIDVAERFAGKGGLKGDRKSTRLNSSHVSISYAVCCLKKKKDTEL